MLTRQWLPLDWVLFIFVGCCFVLTLFIPETLAPVILRRKAENLRKTTGDPNYRTLAELERLPLAQTLKIALFRPIIMLFTEPIVLFMSFCTYSALFVRPLLLTASLDRQIWHLCTVFYVRISLFGGILI